MVAYTPGTLTKNTLARASAVNAENTAIQTALATIPTAAIINEGRVIYAADTGAANAYVVAMSKTLTAYTAGLSLRILIGAGNSNTGASTLNVDSLGVKNILRSDGAAPESNDIRAGSIIEVTYDGTQFILVGHHGSNILTGTTLPLAVSNGGTGVATLADGGLLLGSGTGNVTVMAALADGEVVTGDGTTDPVALALLTSSTGQVKHERGGIEADISAITDGGALVGTSSGVMAVRSGFLTAGAAGFVKHELGGLEFDASAIADGGLIVGTATGTMAIRAGALTAGAAGYLKHEVGGLEADVSAYDGLVHITGGATSAKATSANSLSLIAAASYAAMKTLLGLVIGTDVQAESAVLTDIAAVGANAADSELLVGTAAGALAWESGATLRTSVGVGTGDTPDFTGITFGGTGSTLANYAIGTWTPAVFATGTAGTPSYNTQSGDYIRVGNLVYAMCYLDLNSWAGSPTGDFRLTGLPFTSKSGVNPVGVGAIGYMDNFNTTGLWVAPAAISGTTYMQFREFFDNSVNTTVQASVFGGNFILQISIVYAI